MSITDQKHNFCSKCGKSLIPIGTAGYNVSNGAPVHIKACPTGLCGHDGILHTFVKDSGFWKSFMDARTTLKCSVCGEKEYIEHVDCC